jgi:hypothetical protein
MKETPMTYESKSGVELKPCPFCGKPPTACPDDSNGLATVFCPDVNECAVSPSAEAPVADGGIARAIADWNTRHREDSTRELVEALRLAAPIFCQSICPRPSEQNWPHDPLCRQVQAALSRTGAHNDRSNDISV